MSSLETISKHQQATVLWFNDAKGYGFLKSEEHPTIFAHYTALQGEGFKTLSEGQEVTCEVNVGRNGAQALNIMKQTV